MSSASDLPILNEELDLLKNAFLYNYCYYAITAAICYEHLSTLSDEVHLLWRGKLNISIAIFLANRYLLLLMAAAFILNSLVWDTPLSCEVTDMLYIAALNILELMLALVAALRVYAINRRQWVLAVIALILGSAPVIVNSITVGTSSYQYVIYVGSLPLCDQNSPFSVSLLSYLAIPTRLPPILSDMIVLLVTWFQTFHVVRDARKAGLKASLGALILRDGTLYFVLLLILNVVDIVVAICAYRAKNDDTALFVSVFLVPLASILTTRFILNLRQFSDDSANANLSQTTSVLWQNVDDRSSLASRIIGNLGAEIEYDAPNRLANSTSENDDVEGGDDCDGLGCPDDP